jgi:hypothetical protein
MDYVYELRAGEEIVATGQLSLGRDLQPGDEVPFGAETAVVVDVIPSLTGLTRLVLKLRGQT